MGRILLGADFGTSEVRVVALDMVSGRTIGMAYSPYQNGIIDGSLPTGERLPRGFALQNPADWMDSFADATAKLLSDTRIPKDQIASIGVDFTSCTVLPTDEDGVPLCMKKRFSRDPHAWPKLWKHHAAQPQAERLTEIASDRGEPFLENYGGKIGSEWLWPKLLQVVEESPDLAPHIAYFLEGGDWVVWQMTGVQVRNQCAAGYKACHTKDLGYPSSDFLEQASDLLVGIAEKARQVPIFSPGKLVGRLLPEIADRLGLLEGTPVAAAVIDAHAAVAGAGVYVPNVMAIILGTSTCHLIMSKEERLFTGYAGVVKDGILDGFWGYEAGQPSTGDILDWFKNSLAPMAMFERSKDDDVDISVVLDRYLGEVPPGSGGLLCLDWWGGNRSVLLDSSLTGVIAGFTLQTKPEEIYKAIVEGTAFGTRLITDNFNAGGVHVDKVVATGGLCFFSPQIVQVYADVLGMPVLVPDARQSAARGAAIIGGLSVGPKALGYKTKEQYYSAMKPPELDYVKPEPKNAKIYQQLYHLYLKLHDAFGCAGSLLSKLRGQPHWH